MVQCFALYVATLVPHQPNRQPELNGIIISHCEGKHKVQVAIMGHLWPKLSAGGRGPPTQAWAKVDPSTQMHVQCFMGQSKMCRELVIQVPYHTSSTFPSRPVGKLPWAATFGQPQSPDAEVWRRFNGDCKFGNVCWFVHLCSSCGEQHPECKAVVGPRKRENFQGL